MVFMQRTGGLVLHVILISGDAINLGSSPGRLHWCSFVNLFRNIKSLGYLGRTDPNQDSRKLKGGGSS